jgi:hypothetical protein
MEKCPNTTRQEIKSDRRPILISASAAAAVHVHYVNTCRGRVPRKCKTFLSMANTPPPYAVSVCTR